MKAKYFVDLCVRTRLFYNFRYEWYDRASRFSRSYRDVAMAVDKLVNIPNRELLYDVYAYITDMRSTLALVNSYIKWLGMT